MRNWRETIAVAMNLKVKFRGAHTYCSVITGWYACAQSNSAQRKSRMAKSFFSLFATAIMILFFEQWRCVHSERLRLCVWFYCILTMHFWMSMLKLVLVSHHSLWIPRLHIIFIFITNRSQNIWNCGLTIGVVRRASACTDFRRVNDTSAIRTVNIYY